MKKKEIKKHAKKVMHYVEMAGRTYYGCQEILKDAAFNVAKVKPKPDIVKFHQVKKNNVYVRCEKYREFVLKIILYFANEGMTFREAEKVLKYARKKLLPKYYL